MDRQLLEWERNVPRRRILQENLLPLLTGFEVIPWDRHATDLAARRQAGLLAAARAAGLPDLLIAASAKAANCEAVVTRDKADFERIGLLPVRPH